MRKGLVIVGIVLLAAGCVKPPPAPEPAPRPAPNPPPAPTPPPEPSGEWTDRTATPGDWSYRAEGYGSIASFGSAAAPRFTIRCDTGQRRVRFARPGVLDAGKAARLTLTTTAGSASYALANEGGSPPMVGAVVASTDSFLDKLVYTRGRFLVRTEGQADLVLPAWAEVSRVVEDCRR
jgi:hypothetical protein